LWFAANRHRNSRIWEETAPNIWRRRDQVVTMDNAPQASSVQDVFSDAKIDPKGTGRKYITVGKGVDWPASPDNEEHKASWI
jgi:hypothetical protein